MLRIKFICVLTLSVIIFACNSDDDTVLPDSNSPFNVEHSRKLAMFWSDALESASINFQDGGNPVQYPGGTIWTFGDTFLKDGFRTNSVFHIEDMNNMEYLIDSLGTAEVMIPLKAPENLEEHRIWPAGGIYLNQKMYVFYELIYLNEENVDKNSVKNIGLVKSKDSWKKWERVDNEVKFPFNTPPHSIIEKDNFLYLYFVEKRSGLDSNIDIYRVPSIDIENPLKYEKIAESIVTNVYGQVTVAWNTYLDKFIMCHIGDLFDDPRSIYIRTADSPTGPFSDPVKIYTEPGGLGDNFSGMFYCPYLHPELFINEGETIFVTFCVNEGNTFSNPYLIEVKINDPTQ